MVDYIEFYNNVDIKTIIDNTNDMLNKMTNGAFTMCHGRYHTMFVVDTVEHILKSLSFNSRIIELGKIEALLHDTGCIAGRWNHAQKSAALAKILLNGLGHFSFEEKDIIIQAIEDHSRGDKISSAVGAALLFADKIDFSKRRNLPTNNADAGYTNNLEINNVDIYFVDKSVFINCITTEAFSKNIFINGYTRYNILLRAAKYLDCDLHFLINGTKADIS